MKKIFLHALAFVVFGTLFLSSCKKTEDPAPSTSGTNNGFSGNWNISETSSINGVNTYPLTIEKTNASTILFAYLYGFSTKVSANVTNNSFTIPADTIEGSIVSGYGVLANSNQINMNYYVDNGLFIDSLTATLTK